MKIRINYDLMEKIKESKTGFSLQKNVKMSLKGASIPFLCCVSLDLCLPNPLEEILKDILLFSSINVIARGVLHKIFKNKIKSLSVYDLKVLSSELRKNFINTDYELLQQAYQYETDYSFMLDENKTPRLKQEKYIMVPVVEKDGEKEVSLVQEHIIGTNGYVLSYGSPSKSKVLKPVFNGI